MESYYLGILFALLTILAWGFAVIPVKMAHAPGILGIAYSMPVGLMFLLIPAIYACRDMSASSLSPFLSVSGIQVLIGGLCQFPLATICYYEAIRKAEISTVVPLKCLKSVFVLVIVVIWGLSTVSFNAAFACVIGVSGAYILTSSGKVSGINSISSNRKPIILILLACLFWSLGDILIGRTLASFSALIATPLSLLFGMIAYYVWILSTGKTKLVIQISNRDKLCYAAHGIISFGLGYCAFFLAMNHIGIIKAVIIISTWPLVSFLIGLVLYKESLNIRKVIGVILLLTCVYIIIFK